MLIHGPHFDDLVAAAQGVTIGMPHWRIYQNRLLGPWLVQLISFATGWPFPLSFKLFLIASLLLTGFVSFYIFLDLTKNKVVSLRYSFYLSLCFLAFQDKSWFYLWDLMDVIIFLVFAYSIFRNLSMRYFVCLFIISLLNKEDALFISLWMIIDSFKYDNNSSKNIQTKSLKINYYRLSLGILLMISGMFYTKLVRDSLFVKSMIPGVGLDSYHATIGEHFRIFANIKYLTDFTYLKDENIVVPLLPFLLIIPLVYVLYKLRPDEYLIKVMILFFCMLLLIFMFGSIGETRVFFILIPFVLILNLEFCGQIPKNDRLELS
jgi:hypothetical protein